MSGVPHPFVTVLKVSERGIGEKNARESEQKGRTQNTHAENPKEPTEIRS